MALIAVILVLSPLFVFIYFGLRDTHIGVDLQNDEDFGYARYVETHHRWVAFWVLVPGWILAMLVTIDHLNYFYAWGNYSPIFHMEYDLPESGSVTLVLSWAYLVLCTAWMIFNLVRIARVNRMLRLQWEKLQQDKHARRTVDITNQTEE